MKNIDVPASGVVSGQQIADGVNAGFESLQKSIGGTLVKSVAGGADVTLTEDECQYGFIELTGAITSNINVFVLASTQRSSFKNSTTGGSYTVTVKTPAGTGIAVTRGATQNLRCDGTNVLSDFSEQISAATEAATVAHAAANAAAEIALAAQATANAAIPESGGQLSGPLKGALGTAIASATTIDLSARVGGDVLHITGTAEIDGVTLGAGDIVVAIADAALPLKASANLLIDGVVSGSTYTCAANDRILFIGDSSGKVRIHVIPYAGYGSARIQQGTAISLSGRTAGDWTGLPDWVKEFTVFWYNTSTNGGSSLQMQLGTSSGVENTGYTCTSPGGGLTTGFAVAINPAASYAQTGALTCYRVDATTWVAVGGIWTQGVSGGNLVGFKTLSGNLDRVRFTTVNGTDLFDLGYANIICRG